MKQEDFLSKEMQHDSLAEALPYLLAGFEGRTDGHKINSVTVQQTRFSGYRVVIRAVGRGDSGDRLHVVAFTTGDSPGTALLLSEEAYKSNVIRWSVDRFAKNISDNGTPKDGRRELSITN